MVAGIATGTILGNYELLSTIGVGGMGQVYRARDTRLGRIVAIKVLPPHLFGVRDFSQRFRREALAVSALSHPNICALYDVGELVIEQGGESMTVSYLVMEHLEGETLRERLQSAMSSRQALDIAIQIANALAAAHRKGLIHRDLKPENVFLTRDGVVKVLDFGLVKAVNESASDAPSASHTQPGHILGTAAYMSPEQVRGEAVDHRSDIFAFGVVLYEMLTGLQPFHGETAVETMSQILTIEPRDVAMLSADIPPGLPDIVGHCLVKNVNDRFASARDLAFSLEAISRGSLPPAARRTTTPSRPPRIEPPVGAKKRAAMAAALVAALALTIIGGRFLTHRADDPGPPATRPLTHSGKDSSAAASPDGRLIAFVSLRDGSSRIWLKQLADGTEVAVTVGPEDWAPRFSPDGATIYFTRSTSTSSAIWRVPAVGGQPRKAIDNGFDGDVSPDGRRIAFIRNRIAGSRFSTLCLAPAGGGSVQEIASSTNEELTSPRWSPDGEWIAVTRKPRSSTSGSVMLISPDGEKRRLVARSQPHGLVSGAAWTDDSRAIVFTELETVTSIAMRERGGTARVVLYELGSGSFTPILWNPHASVDTIDVLHGGRLLFAEDFTRLNLQEVSLGKPSDAHWLTRGTAIDRQPSYSPDGNRVVFTSDRGGNTDVWEVVPTTGAVRRLTDDPAVDWDPVVAPDGALLWSSNRGGHFEAWSASADGEGAHQVTTDGADAENPTTPLDRQWIYYDSSHPEKEGLWRVRPDGRDAAPVLRAETAHPEVSADGQYVVYHRPEPGGGSSAVDAVRVADGTVIQIARNLRGADRGRARWLGNTHTIVFFADDEQGRGGLFTQDLDPTRDTTSTRRALTGFDRETTVETFAISPDGKRAVLAIREPASGLMITDPIEALTR
jgi:serine/threonine protein kinase